MANGKLIVILILVFSIFGCAQPAMLQVNHGGDNKVERIDFPDIGLETTRGLGERLVAKGTRTTGPALEIKSNSLFHYSEDPSNATLSCGVQVAPGSAFKSSEIGSTDVVAECFGPFQATPVGPQWNCSQYTVGFRDVCRDKSNGNYFVPLHSLKIKLRSSSDALRQVMKTTQHGDSFIQEIIYNGRVGNNLRIIYREFSNDIARPAFTQEAQYDLSESKVIGFKSLRMEVINSSNTQITYRLVSNF